jgi:hypothetical protein
MLKFKLKASLVAGLSHVINQLSPEVKSIVDPDAIDANIRVMHACDDIDKANATFMEAAKETEGKKKEAFSVYEKEYAEAKETKSVEELTKISASLNAKAKKELDEIDKASAALPDVEVEVELSNEKMEAIRKLFPKTVNQWNDSKIFVEVGLALRNAS